MHYRESHRYHVIGVDRAGVPVPAAFRVSWMHGDQRKTAFLGNPQESRWMASELREDGIEVEVEALEFLPIELMPGFFNQQLRTLVDTELHAELDRVLANAISNIRRRNEQETEN